jgi:hypothetical protein
VSAPPPSGVGRSFRGVNTAPSNPWPDTTNPQAAAKVDACFEMLDEAVAIIALVPKGGRGFDFLGQDLGLCYIVNVSAGEAHRQRI